MPEISKLKYKNCTAKRLKMFIKVTISEKFFRKNTQCSYILV